VVANLQREKGDEDVKIDLVVDRSKRDMGNLMKLNSLQKRVMFVKHVLGDWKPTPKYRTLTD